MVLCRDSCLLISALIAAEFTDLLLLFILTHDLKPSAHFSPFELCRIETAEDGGSTGCLSLAHKRHLTAERLFPLQVN